MKTVLEFQTSNERLNPENEKRQKKRQKQTEKPWNKNKTPAPAYMQDHEETQADTQSGKTAD